MYNKLRELYESDEYPLHMPGHKRQPGFGQVSFETDITEIDGYDDLYDPTGIIKEALDRAKRIYNTQKTFFLVNGSTVGILTAVFATIPQKGSVLMARNCHKSVYHAIELREAKADFINPVQTNGMFAPINPDEVEKLFEHNNYEAVIITSPTYEGKVSDICKIADICHKHNAVLIVDEAHGAHFVFSNKLPESAVRYADIVIQSTHKTLPALTQTGLLHVCSKSVDIGRIEKYLQMFQTSSPSYVLMSSIDSCLKELEEAKEIVWDEFFNKKEKFGALIKDLKHLSLVECDDPCKIVISTANTTISGPKLAKRLLDEYHLQLEMSSATYIVAIVTINDTWDGFLRFAKALIEIDNEISIKERDDRKEFQVSHLLNTKAKDYIYIYPPGIPIALPGQVIDEEILNTIDEYIQAGLKVRGL